MVHNLHFALRAFSPCPGVHSKNQLWSFFTTIQVAKWGAARIFLEYIVSIGFYYGHYGHPGQAIIRWGSEQRYPWFANFAHYSNCHGQVTFALGGALDRVVL